MRLFLFILLIMVGFGMNAHATVFWDDDFETIAPGSITLSSNPWSYNGMQCQVPCPYGDVTASFGHSGTHSFKEIWPAGHEGDAAQEVALNRWVPRTTGDFYLRYYSYTEPGFVYYNITTKSVYIRDETYGYPNGVVNHMFGSREPMYASQGEATANCPTGGGSGTCNYDQQVHVPLNDGQWYCVEFHMHFNTPGVADGYVELWVDQTRVLFYQQRMWRDVAHASTGVDQIRLMKQAGGGVRYIDDVAVGDTRIGCSGSPKSDVTPPAIPTALIIR